MSRWRDPFAQAGWLLADLLLALWLLSSVTSGLPQRRLAPPATQTPIPTATPIAEQPGTPTPTQAAVAVTSICRTFRVSIDGLLSPKDSDRYLQAKARAITEIVASVQDLKGRRVSFALTFATATSTARAGNLAEVVNGLVKGPEVDASVGGLFTAAETRNYIWEKADPVAQGQIWLEMFLPPPLPSDTPSELGCPK